MDGFKARLRHSLYFRLAWVLSTAIVFMALAAGAFSFFSAFEEANELQDDMLLQVAQLIQQQPADALSRMKLDGGHDDDSESGLIVQSLTASEGSDGASRNRLSIPEGLKDGLHSLRLGGDTYRILIRTLGSGRRIAVAQETEVRNEIAQDSAFLTVLPLLILMPVLLLVVAYLVRKMLRPVAQLAKEVDARCEQDLHPLQILNLPSEIRPFVNAINRLLGRVGDAMENQRRFVADAAHELRSPLTALSLQAERLDAAAMSDEARQCLMTLRDGIGRGRHLLEQLLSLARAQNAVPSPVQTVSIRDVYRRVLEDLMPLAEAKGLDIGVLDGADAQIIAHEMDLFTLVRNLADNAIRYTPDGGRIDLSVRQAGRQIILEVEDNGIGIPATERERVFDPFYRVLGSGQTGSGLGLSIASVLAKKLGGRLELRDAARFSQGLKARLIFE